MSRFSLVLLCLPLLFTRCSQNNVTEDQSLKTSFDSAGVRGCFAIYDNDQGQFTIYNIKRYRDSSFMPAQTFGILESLVAIQTGVLKDETSGLADAFRSPDTTAFFTGLGPRLGIDTIKKWVDSLHYGNMDLRAGVQNILTTDSLRITPDEELGLVKKLYFNQLPFFDRTQSIVVKVMLREDNVNYKLSYIDAAGLDRNGHSIGWLAGWIEENKHPYFFVLNTAAEVPATNSPGARIRILRGVLGRLGFFHGRK